MPAPPAHLVLGPPGHGVRILAEQLSDSVGAERVGDWDSARDHERVHVHVTDRLLEPDHDPTARLARLARHVRLTLTLHDVPQPADGPAFRRRRGVYRRLLDLAAGWAVSSRHEEALVHEHLAPRTKGLVSPLPVLPVPAYENSFLPDWPDGATAAVFGFVYPGKGHAELIRAAAAVQDRSPMTVLGLGAPASGHEDLALDLDRLAAGLGVRFRLTGHLTDRAKVAALRRVGVGVCGHQKVSASGSTNDWIAAGRRPLVLRGRYSREMEGRRPGCHRLYAPSDLADELVTALAAPERTWLTADQDTRPHLEDTGPRLPGVVDHPVTPPPFGSTVVGNGWDLAVGPAPPERTVSVVVTHYDQPRELARTLHALTRQTRPPVEVVVADDGSERIPDIGPGVRVVHQPDQGFRAAAARNLGARTCSGDVLLFLDADTTPEPTFVERLTRLPALLPELVAVGRRRHARLGPLPVEEPVEDAGPRHELEEPAWLAQGYERTGALLHADVTSYRFVISAVLACSRWWFEHLGGFEADMTGYGNEDWDLGHRSWREGGLVAHVPGAVAWHDGPASGSTGRPADPDVLLAATMALAERAGAPGATYRGLLMGARDVVVTADPSLTRNGLVQTLDSLLAAVPRAVVVLDPGAAGWFGEEPRVTSRPGPLGTTDAWLSSTFRIHLHVTAATTGPEAIWREVLAQLDGPDAAATTVVLDQDGEPAGLVHDLRQHRRHARWRPAGIDTPTSTTWVRHALAPVGEAPLQRWLEGWAGSPAR